MKTEILTEQEALRAVRILTRAGDQFPSGSDRDELIEVIELFETLNERGRLLFRIAETACELLRIEPTSSIYPDKRGDLAAALTELRSIGWIPEAEEPFDYEVYLASPEWLARREDAVTRAGGRCQLCNSPERLNVHHRTYERIGRERPEDLTVLCAACHSASHDRRRLFLRRDEQ